jgi:hypothetical protein
MLCKNVYITVVINHGFRHNVRKIGVINCDKVLSNFYFFLTWGWAEAKFLVAGAIFRVALVLYFVEDFYLLGYNTV